MSRAALFLDRDGTLLELVPYLCHPDQVRLIEGAAEGLRRAAEAGWLRIVVTNQSGIGRGLFGMEEVERVHRRMVDLLAEEGSGVDGIEICPHFPERDGPCDCRKPAPGMLARTIARHGIDPSRSWIVGDRWDDLAAGAAVGIRGILVLTGYGREEATLEPTSGWEAIRHVAHDLPAAIQFLMREERRRRERWWV